jgi:O-antigen/teichoic acid export membrane protein
MWHFGKYGLVGNSMYTIFMQMDIFFVSSIAGFAWVAAYSVAKTFNRVFDMMTGVIQMFLLPFSSKAGAEGNTSGLVTVAEKTICFSFIALLPCFIVMFFFPQPFLHLIYKGKYDDAAPIMRVLSLFALILPVNAVIGSYLQGLGKVREGFISGVVLVCISVPLYYFLTPVWGAVGTAAGLVTGFLITTIGLVIYLRTFAPITLKGVLLRVGDIRNFLIKFLSRS